MVLLVINIIKQKYHYPEIYITNVDEIFFI